MTDALIGYSGFVGSTLLRQRQFKRTYRSTNIAEIAGQRFDTVVCCGAPAQKWLANREPVADLRNIEALIANLERMHCRRFVLVSSVDVFRVPQEVDESSVVEEDDLQPYGLHRRRLEKYVEARFSTRLIVRLPGLVGHGLRKNVVYDLRHGNNLHAIDSRGSFQFYPMCNLWYDIDVALAHSISLIHLTATPVTVAEVAREGFGRSFEQVLPKGDPARYDMRSRYAHLWGSANPYQYSRKESMQAVRAYAQS